MLTTAIDHLLGTMTITILPIYDLLHSSQLLRLQNLADPRLHLHRQSQGLRHRLRRLHTAPHGKQSLRRGAEGECLGSGVWMRYGVYCLRSFYTSFRSSELKTQRESLWCARKAWRKQVSSLGFGAVCYLGPRTIDQPRTSSKLHHVLSPKRQDI